MASRPRLLLSTLAVAAFASAHAAELGDPRVSSHIGQPLVADVELTMLEDAATPVQVRVASPEVYSGAGIAVPPVLSSLNLSVMRRDGRQFLHVTSPRPVDADHVHLYLELVDKGQRAVRLATLWLTPDPNPAPVRAAPVPVPVVVAPAAAGTDAALLAQVERARTAPAAAQPVPRPVPPAPPTAPVVRRPRPAPVPKPAALPVAQADAHPPVCARPAAEVQACAALGAKNDELRARLGQVEDRVKKLQVTLGAPAAARAQDAAGPAPAKASAAQAAPSKDAVKPAPAKAPAANPAPSKDAGKPEAAKESAPQTTPSNDAARPEPGKAPAETTAAPSKDAGTPEPAKADASAPETAAPPPPKPVVPAGPRPIHSIKPLVPHKPKAPPPEEGLPWGWIGAAAGVLALGGAGAFLVVRRRRTAPAAVATPGLLDKLKARFAARTKAPAPEDDAAAEPSLE